jgi:hypothetical protein
LTSGEALTIEDAAGAIGDRDLEHVLGKIDRYDRGIHGISSW